MQNHALEESVLLNKSVLRVFKSSNFWVRNFDARYFWGVKFQTHVFLWGGFAI